MGTDMLFQLEIILRLLSGTKIHLIRIGVCSLYNSIARNHNHMMVNIFNLMLLGQTLLLSLAICMLVQ